MVALTDKKAASAKPAGISRLDPFFDGTFVERMAALLFGAGAAGAGAAGIAAEGIGLETVGLGAAGAGALGAEGAEIGAGVARAASHGTGLGGIFRNVFSFASENAAQMATQRFFDHLFHGARTKTEGNSMPGFEDVDEIARRAGTHALTPEQIEAVLKDLKRYDKWGNPGQIVAESVEGMGLIRKQLQTFAASAQDEKANELRALSSYFNGLGLDLPDIEYAKRARRLLAKFIHTDVAPGLNDAIIKEVNRTLDIFIQAKSRADYQSTIKDFKSNRPEIYESLRQAVEYLSQADWEGAFQAAVNSGAQLTAGDHLKTSLRPDTVLGRLSYDFKNASQLRQGGMVFGTVTGVAGATYFSTKALDEYLQLKEARQHPEQQNNARWRNVALYGATALGSAGVTAAALNGCRLQGGVFR